MPDEQKFSIKVTGSGTKYQIMESLKELLESMIDLDGKADWEDETTMTTIRTIDEDEE